MLCKSGGAPILGGMSQMFMILLFVVMLAILGVLGLGMAGVARGGDPARANRLMQARVILQGVALVLLVLMMATRR